MTEEQPVFDFDEMSWGEAKQVSIIGLGIQKAAANADETALTAGYAALEAIVAHVVVSLPRSWLVKRAPADVDFQQPGAFDWLKQGKFAEITKQINAHIETKEDDAKN